MNRTLSVILICKNRLLREMLFRAINKIPSLTIIEQFQHVDDLPGALQKTPVDWVIFSIQPAQQVPPIVDATIAAYPATCFFSISEDGEQFKMRWLEPHEQNLVDATLEDLAANYLQAPR